MFIPELDTFLEEFKTEAVEAMQTGKPSVVDRRYNLNANMVGHWVREYKDGKFGNIDVASFARL